MLATNDSVGWPIALVVIVLIVFVYGPDLINAWRGRDKDE